MNKRLRKFVVEPRFLLALTTGRGEFLTIEKGFPGDARVVCEEFDQRGRFVLTVASETFPEFEGTEIPEGTVLVRREHVRNPSAEGNELFASSLAGRLNVWLRDPSGQEAIARLLNLTASVPDSFMPYMQREPNGEVSVFALLAGLTGTPTTFGARCKVEVVDGQSKMIDPLVFEAFSTPTLLPTPADMPIPDNGEREHGCFTTDPVTMSDCRGDGWFRCPECAAFSLAGDGKVDGSPHADDPGAHADDCGKCGQCQACPDGAAEVLADAEGREP